MSQSIDPKTVLARLDAEKRLATQAAKIDAASNVMALKDVPRRSVVAILLYDGSLVEGSLELAPIYISPVTQQPAGRISIKVEGELGLRRIEASQVASVDVVVRARQVLFSLNLTLKGIIMSHSQVPAADFSAVLNEKDVMDAVVTLKINVSNYLYHHLHSGNFPNAQKLIEISESGINGSLIEGFSAKVEMEVDYTGNYTEPFNKDVLAWIAAAQRDLFLALKETFGEGKILYPQLDFAARGMPVAAGIEILHPSGTLFVQRVMQVYRSSYNRSSYTRHFFHSGSRPEATSFQVEVQDQNKDRVRAAALTMEAALGEIANGQRKPNTLPLNDLAVLVAFAKTQTQS